MSLVAVSHGPASGNLPFPVSQFPLRQFRVRPLKKTLLSVPLDELRPTQMAVGMRAVAARGTVSLAAAAGVSAEFRNV